MIKTFFLFTYPYIHENLFIHLYTFITDSINYIFSFLLLRNDDAAISLLRSVGLFQAYHNRHGQGRTRGIGKL